MELQQIESFIQVAKDMSFSKAAKKMYVTQSTISARIQKLESDLGVLLLHRSGKEVSLSPFGKIFLPFAEQCLEAITAAKRKLEEEKKYSAGRLRIGVTNPFSTYVFPHVLPEIYYKFPEIKIQVVSLMHSDDVFALLRESKIDIGFVNDTERPKGSPMDYLSRTALYESPLVLVANPAHPLGRLKSVPISAVSQYAFIHLSTRTAQAKLVFQYFEANQVKPASYIEINSVSAAKEVIKTGSILTLLPNLVVKEEIEKRELIRLPLVPAPPSVITSLVYRKDYPDKEVIGFIKDKVTLASTKTSNPKMGTGGVSGQ